MTEALKDLWHTAATVAPKVLLFLAILAVGYFVARIVGNAVGKLLSKVGFDTLIDRAGLGRTNAYPHDIAAKLAYYSALLLVLQLAFGVFGPNPVSSLITSVIAFLPRIAVALALIVVAGYIASKVRDLIVAAGILWANVLGTAAQVFVLGLGVIAALAQVGVAVSVTTPVLVAVLATAAGILIVGVGGGLIKPMQERWEDILAESEDRIARHLKSKDTEPEATVHKATITVTTREK